MSATTGGKAFMSDIHHHPGDPLLFGQDLREAALCETERVLAAVERDTPDTALLHVERLQGSGRTDGRGRTHTFDGCVALAESLGAFVGMED